MFELIFVLLTFGDKGVRVLAGPLLRSKILWYAQNSLIRSTKKTRHITVFDAMPCLTVFKYMHFEVRIHTFDICLSLFEIILIKSIQ